MRPVDSFRYDIQALRAVAVLLVLVFHVWPDFLPGGYIGVDVFFVISGYLITSSLNRELIHYGELRFGRFYVRRFRRLMPAASLVIVVTMALSYLLEPSFRRMGTAEEGIASALYWQNWLMAWRSVDYLAAERTLGPLTHYWSLSVEEQFYLGWPLILAASHLAGRVRGWGARSTSVATIAGITLLSLAASGLMAYWRLPEAYFVTHTRVWELGIGALLALLPLPQLKNAAWGRLLIPAMLAMIAACAYLMPPAVAFPGLIALVPTFGAAVLIHVGERARAGSIARSRLVQVVGDASYSIYLWHWPLVYFATLGAASEPDVVNGVGLMLASIILGWLSKIYVEDVFRSAPDTDGRIRARVGAIGSGAFLAASVVAAAALFQIARDGIESWDGLVFVRDHPGALTLTDGVAGTPDVDPRPPLAAVKEDMPEIYDNDCHTSLRITEPKVCEHTSSRSEGSLVVLTGDSHAANWVPALKEAAKHGGWRFISITKAGCSLSYQPPSDAARADPPCIAWSHGTVAKLKELKPDLVLLARSRRGSDYGHESGEPWVEGLHPMLDQVLGDLEKVASRVAVIADTPRLPYDPPTCIAQQRDCAIPIADTRHRPDALLNVAKSRPTIQRIDMLPYVCPQETCPAIIGNVIVWRDKHHLTATYSRTLAPQFKSVVDEILQSER